MGYKEFQLLMLFWNLGLVDTFSVIKLCVNCGSQYMGVVLSSATAIERRQRIATLASFLAASGGALTTDPTTNAAMGAAVASKIVYMRAILTRGGGNSNIAKSISSSSLKEFAIIVDSVKTPVLDIHPYRIEFTNNSKMIIDNIFHEHTARRYLQGSAQKIKTVAPNYLAPMAAASTRVNTTAVIGWTSLGAFYLFQRAERKCWQNQNNKIVIDVTASPSD